MRRAGGVVGGNLNSDKKRLYRILPSRNRQDLPTSNDARFRSALYVQNSASTAVIDTHRHALQAVVDMSGLEHLTQEVASCRRDIKRRTWYHFLRLPPRR